MTSPRDLLLTPLQRCCLVALLALLGLLAGACSSADEAVAGADDASTESSASEPTASATTVSEDEPEASTADSGDDSESESEPAAPTAVAEVDSDAASEPEAPTAEPAEDDSPTVEPEEAAQPTEVPEAAEGLCGGAMSVVFDEGAPRDRMTVTNESTGEISFASVEFDLTGSVGRIIFDTLSGGSGVEVFQDFQVEGGEAELAGDPIADDGSTSLRLDFTSFAPGESFTFSIDVDDQLTDSDLGQIQVTGAEIEGATVIVQTTTGDTLTATFGADSTAGLAASC